MTQPSEPAGTGESPLIRWSVQLACHVLGVLTVAGLLLVAVFDRSTLEIVWHSMSLPGYAEQIWVDVALHIGLASCLWALIALGFQVFTASRQPVKKLLGTRRGGVMTETLVVLPVFLLLTFGIAQLAVNNMAGLIANTAVFQSGRTVWLWSSEADAGRRGVNDTKVKNLARVQAAAVMTPVAPGDFVQDITGGTDEFEQMRGVLLGSQLPAFSTDSGQLAMTATPAFLAGTALTKNPLQDSSFYRAFDDSNFRSRTVRKFTFAYHATEVTVIENTEEVGASLVYRHQQAFPFVSHIFGDLDVVGARPDHYTTIEREFTMPRQIPPNTQVP